MKLKKIDWFLIIFLLIIIILTPIILLNPNFAEYFNVANWFGSENYESFSYWGAIGFLIIVSILGALIPIPIPYIIPSALFASAWANSTTVSNPCLKIVGMVLFAAFGNTIGDFLDYIIGDGAGHVMVKDEDGEKKMNKWSELILKKPKTVPVIITLFGMTPLPDSLLLVPLGLVKYPIKKTLLFMYIGKVAMFTIVVIAGILSIEPILELLGESGSSGVIIGVVLLYLMWAIVAVMAKLDIGKEKGKKEKGKKEKGKKEKGKKE